MGAADATSQHRLLEKSSLVRRVSFCPLQIRWQSEGLATTWWAIPPWLYSATRSLRRGIGDGVGYGVPKLQIRPGHSQRKPQCSSLQGWNFGRTSGASLWWPCLSWSSHLHAWWGNTTHCQDFDGFPAPVSHGSASLAFPQPWLKSNWTCMGLHQTTSERNGPACPIIGRAARTDPWGVASYATAVCQTSDSQYAEESGSSYCGRWWFHTLLTVIVLSLLSFCLFICHYVISLWYIVFYPCICLRKSINWLLKTVIVHTDLVFTFCLIPCVTVPAVQKVGISGPWVWVLWSVLHITGVFPLSSQYTIHRSLRHLHCLGNVRYCSPRCFHPNDLPSLADGTFPHDEVKLTGHKKLAFGVAKVALVSTLLFKDYKVNLTNFCHTCYQVYTHHIDNFSGSHSMPNTMKNKFGKFLQELFSRGVGQGARNLEVCPTQLMNKRQGSMPIDEYL